MESHSKFSVSGIFKQHDPTTPQQKVSFEERSWRESSPLQMVETQFLRRNFIDLLRGPCSEPDSGISSCVWVCVCGVCVCVCGVCVCVRGGGFVGFIFYS